MDYVRLFRLAFVVAWLNMGLPNPRCDDACQCVPTSALHQNHELDRVNPLSPFRAHQDDTTSTSFKKSLNRAGTTVCGTQYALVRGADPRRRSCKRLARSNALSIASLQTKSQSTERESGVPESPWYPI